MFTFLVQKRHSYGVIPILKEDGGYRVLLINQKDSKGDYWTFPKGTPEKGESGQQTALRETKEETGLEIEMLDEDFSYNEEYTFESRGERIEKVVTYYIGTPLSRETTAQEAEVHECVWMALEVAKRKVTFDGARSVLEAIEKHLPNSRLFAEK